MCSTVNLSIFTLLLGCCSVAKRCLTVWDPMGCSPPGSSIQGIFQTRILDYVAMFFFKVSSWCRDWTWISCIGRQIVYHWGIWEGPLAGYCRPVLLEMYIFYFRKILLLAFFNSFPLSFFFFFLFIIKFQFVECWIF